MKVDMKSYAAFFVLFVMGSVQAFGASTEEVELPVQQVFVPAHGYDDNDVVQLVVYGNLPNACYHVGETKIEKLPDGFGFRLKQFAIRNNDMICAQGDAKLPAHIMSLVPYTLEYTLGTLEKGTYTIHFSDVGTGGRSRRFIVDSAPAGDRDTYPYAAVSNAMIPDILYKGQTVYVTLTGVYQNGCTTMDRVMLKKESDVYILMPILKVLPRSNCTNAMTPFKIKVRLTDHIEAGDYLLHVRSMSGKAINRVFEVYPR